MTSDLERLGAAKYAALTTYKKDGTPKPTAVWLARDGDRLVVWTASDTWKVKRIRNRADIRLQESDVRGRVKGPAPVTGTASVLDRAGSNHVRSVIARKYGLLGAITTWVSRLRRGTEGTVGIAITLTS